MDKYETIPYSQAEFKLGKQRDLEITKFYRVPGKQMVRVTQAGRSVGEYDNVYFISNFRRQYDPPIAQPTTVFQEPEKPAEPVNQEEQQCFDSAVQNTVDMSIEPVILEPPKKQRGRPKGSKAKKGSNEQQSGAVQASQP